MTYIDFSDSLGQIENRFAVQESTKLRTRVHSTAHRNISDNLRGQILTGKFAPGTRLPSVRELATTWGSSIFTVQTALRGLVKEGWIDRRHGAGTYIADPRKRFVDVGIYYWTHFGANTESAFIRNLHFTLLDRLHRLKKRTHVFIDPRPWKKQISVLPEVAEAIRERRIQCLIAPSVNAFNSHILAELPVPTAFMSNPDSLNDTYSDHEQFFRESVRQLVAQGCRTVGLISNIYVGTKGEEVFKNLYEYFRQATADSGLATREEWISKPDGFVHDLEGFGYKELKKLAKLKEKPEGLIVLVDTVALGVIIAVLDLGLDKAPHPMKFVFHRNAQVNLLCPFPVTWAISDETILADSLIRLLQRQFDGEKNSPILVPYVFKRDK